MDVDAVEVIVESLQSSLGIDTWMVLDVCKVQNVLRSLIPMQGVPVDGESSRRRMSKM